MAATVSVVSAGSVPVVSVVVADVVTVVVRFAAVVFCYVAAVVDASAAGTASTGFASWALQPASSMERAEASSQKCFFIVCSFSFGYDQYSMDPTKSKGKATDRLFIYWKEERCYSVPSRVWCRIPNHSRTQ